MMKIEKALAQTDLNVFRDAPAQILAKEILRYQKFSVDAALKKINRASYSVNTAKILLGQGFRYLETGTYNPHTGFKRVAEQIEKYRNSISALTPAASEARKPRKRRKDLGSNKQTPDHDASNINVRRCDIPAEVVEKFEYFVQLNDDNCLYIWRTAAERDAFIKGMCATCAPQKIATGHLVRSDIKVIERR